MIKNCPNCNTEIEVKTGLNYCYNCKKALVLSTTNQIEINANTQVSTLAGFLWLLCIPLAGLWLLFNKNNVLGLFFFVVFISAVLSYPIVLIMQYIKNDYIITKIGVLFKGKALAFIAITGTAIITLGLIMIFLIVRN